jgi:hypothetical protein
MLVEEKNASLNTLSVIIQALHVQGKQMTLAVFRQLPTMVVDKNCSIWGIVRYEIKDSGNLWLVFSFNNCLYRMELDLRKPSDYYLNGYKQKLADPNSYWAYKIPSHGLETEIALQQKKFDEEKQRLELHQYYANNYPQLFIAV